MKFIFIANRRVIKERENGNSVEFGELLRECDKTIMLSCANILNYNGSLVVLKGG